MHLFCGSAASILRIRRSSRTAAASILRIRCICSADQLHLFCGSDAVAGQQLHLFCGSDAVAGVGPHHVGHVDFARHHPVLVVVCGAPPVWGTPAQHVRVHLLEVILLERIENPTRFLAPTHQLKRNCQPLNNTAYLIIYKLCHGTLT